MNEYGPRAGIETRLRRILNSYAYAQSLGDFKDIILEVHTAVEEVLDSQFSLEDRPESFNQKVQQIYPDLYDFYNISDLTRLRNQIAHPKRVFKVAEVQPAAKSFVDFVLAAWPDLFGSQPPVIIHPGVSQPRLEPVLPPPPPLIFPIEPAAFPEEAESLPPASKSHQPPNLRGPLIPFRVTIPAGFRDILHLPWHHLLFSFASVWIGVMIIGVMVYMTTSSSTTLLLLGFGMLIFFGASLGYLVHFLIRLGLKRIFAAALTLLMVTTLFFSARQPAGTEWNIRMVEGFGIALTTPFYWLTQAGQLAYESGQEFGQRNFTNGETVEVGESGDALVLERTMQALFPPTPNVLTPNEPTTSVTAIPKRAQSAGEIFIGGRVKVETDGSRLRGRDAPGMASSVIAMFEPGAILWVLDGPVELDGYTWWKVESGEQTGWSAANFMSPVD